MFIGIQIADRQPRAALRAAAKGRNAFACGASALDGASHHAAAMRVTCAGHSIFEANRCETSVHGGFVFIEIQHAYRQPRAALRVAAKGWSVLACGASALDGACHHAADHA